MCILKFLQCLWLPRCTKKSCLMLRAVEFLVNFYRSKLIPKQGPSWMIIREKRRRNIQRIR